MSKRKPTKTKLKDKKDVADELNQFDSESKKANLQKKETKSTPTDENKENESDSGQGIYSKIFDMWDEDEFLPEDLMTEVAVDSLESKVGYSSLLRQMSDAFSNRMAFYRSEEGGSLSKNEALKKAFRACENKEEAKKKFSFLMSLPIDGISFIDLLHLQDFAPRVAERFWERVKKEGRKEFESGHYSANTLFPVSYMKKLWDVARYLGIRESFVDEWKPKGGIEISLIDMLAQSFFQWQHWLEQTILRSTTEPRQEQYEYREWKKRTNNLDIPKSWEKGEWFPPYVKEQEALEHAVKMADRFHKMFTRTLRQLRDLRRYSVTINNPKQVNIAADGGKQINMNNE